MDKMEIDQAGCMICHVGHQFGCDEEMGHQWVYPVVTNTTISRMVLYNKHIYSLLLEIFSEF